MESAETIVIVGAGQAGYWATHTLRKQGYGGRIVLVGNEPHAPYERPPLSKQVLKGEAEPPSTWLATPDKLSELEAEFLPGRTAIALDRQGRHVELHDGTRIGYDRLLLTTGARPRRLSIPSQSDAAVFYLRDIADSLALRERLATARHVTVIEAADRLMSRVVGPEISAHFAELHRARGTEILSGRMPERIEAGGRSE